MVVEWNGSSGHNWHKSWRATQPRPDLPWESVHGPRRSVIAPDGYKLNLAAHDACELYDLNADPAETRNLFTDPGQQARIGAMAGRLRTWQTRVADPAQVHAAL